MGQGTVPPREYAAKIPRSEAILGSSCGGAVAVQILPADQGDADGLLNRVLQAEAELAHAGHEGSIA